MAAELEKTLGADVELIRGDGGIFDVEVDGQLVFSKKKVGRFPNPGEVVKLIREKQNG